MEDKQTIYESMPVEDLKLELCTESDDDNIHLINCLIEQKSGRDYYDVNLSLH